MRRPRGGKIFVVFNNRGFRRIAEGEDAGWRTARVVVGFARQPGQYFKRPDIQKELTRYARAFASFAKQPFRPRARLASRRTPPPPVTRRMRTRRRRRGQGTPEKPRRRPSCCLCNHRRPSHSRPPHGATLHRVPLARLIANNRLTSKSGLILKDNWKGIVPAAFTRKNKGGLPAGGRGAVVPGRTRGESESLVTRQVSPPSTRLAYF